MTEQREPRVDADGFETHPEKGADAGQSHRSVGGQDSWEERFDRFASGGGKGLCQIKSEVEEAVMALLPPQVTQHLVEAHKELIRAGQRLGDLAVEELERKAERAREIYDFGRRK